mmetsp:Transcript_63457/g.127249  ORF Transcript_63457/g.127249 Transcript_63457/m.127249 type:complete len:113 (+) Transcript_63457:335-673(+)
MGKRPDIYVPSLHTYIEIKTWVWGPQPKNQFSGNAFKQLDGGQSLLLHKYSNRKGSEPVVLQSVIARGEAGPDDCETRLLALSKLMVLPLFSEWIAFLEKNLPIYNAVEQQE